MPLVNAYTTLPAAQADLRIGDDGDAALLEAVITAVCRQIDEELGRCFYAATATRLYTADHPALLLIDDLLSVTTLKTDEDGDRIYEVTWSANRDYYLDPANATADNRPYTAILADARNGLYRFPAVERGVQVVGSWGYCATGSHPPAIERAALLQVGRLYKRRDAPLGVAGSAETGLMRVVPLDPDVKAMLWPYRRRRGFG